MAALRFLLLGLALGLATRGQAAELPPTRSVVYKQVASVSLQLQIFEPADLKPGEARPGIVFFFGGGWINGSPEQFYPQCAALAKLGMIAMSADYRTASKNQTSPQECVMDAKSCLRFIHTHAAELHLDLNRFAAGGGSAGGHLAIAALVLPGFNQPGEDTSVPCEATALVLFNPVIDNGPTGYGYDRVKDYSAEFSPAHNLRRGLPPTLLQFGTKDKFVPVATAEKFQADMERLGNRCDLILYPDQAHGFFNAKGDQHEYYDKTLAATETFLRSVGLLPAAKSNPAVIH